MRLNLSLSHIRENLSESINSYPNFFDLFSKPYLIEKHTILTAPSIEVLSLIRQQRQKLPDSVQGALVVDNPTMPKVKTRAGQEEPEQQLSNLPHAEAEAIKIAELLDTEPLTGENATKAAIVPLLSQARMIHFARYIKPGNFRQKSEKPFIAT